MSGVLLLLFFSLKFQGDHSTKVEAVVRCVLDILRSDCYTKLLIFSSVILFSFYVLLIFQAYFVVYVIMSSMIC
jgi:hypothetical protein